MRPFNHSFRHSIQSIQTDVSLVCLVWLRKRKECWIEPQLINYSAIAVCLQSFNLNSVIHSIWFHQIIHSFFSGLSAFQLSFSFRIQNWISFAAFSSFHYWLPLKLIALNSLQQQSFFRQSLIYLLSRKRANTRSPEMKSIFMKTCNEVLMN